MIKNISLLESIIHIEDLPPREFIRELKTINQKIITEKLDGANLWFGVDERGFFTSREGKHSSHKRFYSVEDYPLIANYNGFRAAHLALERAKKIILKYFQPGDTAEIEVVFGPRPNTVSYGASDKNHIVILRGVDGTPDEKVRKLAAALNGQEVTVTSTVLSSADGNTLQKTEENLKWRFDSVKPIKNISTEEVNDRIEALERFLDEKNKSLSNLTNDQVVTISLNKVKVDERDGVKKERERLKKYILDNFTLPIKQVLLSKFVKKLKPMLSDGDAIGSSDGVEGVVLRDPSSNDQVKIVDRDEFTAINFFNSAIRSQVSGIVKTLDQDAPIEKRGGSFGQALIRISNILGVKDLALNSGLKKAVSKFNADSSKGVAKNISDSLNLEHFDSIKRKVTAILENAEKEINELLTNFKSDSNVYTLKLKSGKEVKLSPEVIKRTLTAFAESKRDVSTMISGVKAAKDASELVFAVYGKSIEKILKNKGAETVKENSYKSFSLLKMATEQAEGGADASAAGSDAATASADAPQQADSTRAGAIAPYPFRLMNGKVVIKRKKSFAPYKRFKRPSAVNESRYLLKNINEMDVKTDDKVSKASDVEFGGARNKLNTTNFNASDVSNYLDKAHEINDEVDSIAFGLELDDGKIVKVYVDAQQAEEFEKALGEMLGKEDDIEDALNELAQKYNIVDVVWPEDEVDDAENEVDEPNVELNAADGAEGLPGAEDGSTEIDTTINRVEDDEDDSAETEKTETEKYKHLKQLLSDEGEAASAVEKEVSKKSTKSSSYDNLKRLIAKEGENDMSLISDNFKIILEARKKSHKKDDQQERPKGRDFVNKDEAKDELENGASEELKKLLKSFPAQQDKVIIRLMVSLGAPAKNLAIYTHLLRGSIEQASDRYLKNASFRMWVKKLLSAIEKAEKVVESLSFDKRLQTKYQHMAYNILLEIGMPAAIEKIATKDLLSGIKRVSKLAVENNDVRLNLIAVAEELGVADETRSMVDTVKEQVEESPEDAARLAIIDFLNMFGVDTTKNSSVERQLSRPDVRVHTARLGKSKDAMQRFSAFKDRLKKLNITSESYDLSDSFYREVESRDVEANESGERVNWMFANLASSGLTLRSDSMSIKLDVDQVDVLKSALENREEAVISDKGGVDYSLTPREDGFSIVEVNNEDNADELTSKEVQSLLEMLD